MKINLKNGFYQGKYYLKDSSPSDFLGIQDVFTISDNLKIEMEGQRVFLRSLESLPKTHFFPEGALLDKTTDELYTYDSESSVSKGEIEYSIYINNNDLSKSYIFSKGCLYKRILLNPKDYEFEKENIFDTIINLFRRR